MSEDTVKRWMDNYDYIDSKDIREYNRKRKTQFSPMEQAVLVYHSNVIPVEDKLQIWHELDETFSEAEFQQVHYMINKEDKMNKDILRYTIDGFEKALSERHNSNGKQQMYEARFWECDYPDEIHVVNGFFYEFDEAYSFLQAEKSEYMLDEGLKTCKTKAEIIRVNIGEAYGRKGKIYVYDNDMDLIHIYPEGNVFEENSLWSVYLKIPLPFKKGDLVKTNDADKVMYGIINYDNQWETLYPHDKYADATTMYCWCDMYYKQNPNGGCPFIQGEFEYLGMEFCDEQELQGEYNPLLLLQKGYRGEISLGAMVRDILLDKEI
jgi:hypothetical protein